MGCVIPEILHRMLSDEDVEWRPGPEEDVDVSPKEVKKNVLNGNKGQPHDAQAID